jgi:tetratricopeptide (TPR) repeat protein
MGHNRGMPLTPTNLDWREPQGWEVRSGVTHRVVAFDPNLWSSAPASFGPGATERYRHLAREAEFGAWWADACGGEAPGQRRFLIQTPNDHWDRPWEAMIAALDDHRWADVSIARRISANTLLPQRVEAGDQLRILILQGRETGPGLGGLDLNRELAQLELARSELDCEVQTLVAPFAVRRPSKEELTDTLARARANVLWLSGHATSDPPQFLLDDGSWLTPDGLADSISQVVAGGGRPPLYVILWACRTGQSQRFAAPRAAPPFIAALAEVGVAAVLATLGPLADDVAPTVARSVLSQLAVGRPLDHAIARARGDLMRQQMVDKARDDWACPVVWCVDLPPDYIVWSEATLPAQRQILARRLLPSGLQPPSLDEPARQQSIIWSRYCRIWVQSPVVGSNQARAEWLSRVIEQQVLGPRPILMIDFRERNANWVLRDWADMVLRKLDQADDPDASLRGHALAIREDREQGWLGLCRSGTFTLALLQPSEDSPEWLWRGLRQDRISGIVLALSFPLARAAEGWKVETLDTSMHPEKGPVSGGRLEAAMAVIGFPAEEIDIEAAVSDDTDYLRARLADGTIVVTRGGCILPLSRADEIARGLDGEALREAHSLAFQILSGPRATVKASEGMAEELQKARMYHAELAEWDTALADASQRLMSCYRDQRRASALLGVFERVRTVHRKLDPVWKVSAGWAYISVGSPDDARDWLNAVDDDVLEPGDAATKHILLAEVQKSSGELGSKAKARAELETALVLLDDDQTDYAKRTKLQARHDLARLTHFIEHDPAAAIPLYVSLERDWQALPNANLDRAIILRNLSEAEMMVADAAAPNAESLYCQAEAHLNAARDLLPPNIGHMVAAELEYVAGRLALRRNSGLGRAQELFRKSAKIARDANQFMMAAIAEARIFWMEAPPPAKANKFDPGAWDRRATDLEPFRKHAWAARVLITGHLRSARRLMAEGLLRQAVGPFCAANALLEANPAFDEGEDRKRIVATLAGRVLVGNANGVAWRELPTRYSWAAELLRTLGVSGPEDALRLID